MKVSDQPLPDEAALDVHPDAMLERPQLAIGVAYAVAIWADIEARLEGLFLSCTGDPEALLEFRELKGWDKRVKYFVKHVKAHQGEAAGIAVQAVLRTVAVPAKKRNEVAHGIWAICETLADDLVLLPHTAYLDIATDVRRAEEEGSARVDLEHDILGSARVVGTAHVQLLVQELSEARNLVHAFMIEKLPEIVHVHGRDEIQSTTSNPKVAARIRNAEVTAAKRKRRGSTST